MASRPRCGSWRAVVAVLAVAASLGCQEAAGAVTARGHTSLLDNFNISWAISDATGPQAGTIALNLTWQAATNTIWAAIGLHEQPQDLSMMKAEMFMCSANATSQYCQCRNTAVGTYTVPTLDAVQYLSNVGLTVTNGIATASFERPVRANPKAKLSFDIAYKKPMGLLYAYGPWTGAAMPAGTPAMHTFMGAIDLDFYDAGPTPPAPPPPPPPSPPAPSPGPPARKAGVWPVRFDSNLTVAPGQAPKATLVTSLTSRIRYSFPARSQRWDMAVIGSPKVVYSEVWVNTTLFSIDWTASPAQCVATELGIGILRPNWLQSTTYGGTHYILGQTSGPSNYTLADLWLAPAVGGGEFNSWAVANSSTARPLRLEGPDKVGKPELAVLEFDSFEAVDGFTPGVFAVPAACTKPRVGGAEEPGAGAGDGRFSLGRFMSRLHRGQ